MRTRSIFSDDSEYLEHYGILGMKWGVRNAETQRKYAGGNNKAYTYKATGKQIAKDGLERDFAVKSMSQVRVNAKGGLEHRNVTNVSKARASVAKKITKDKKLRSLNRAYVETEKKHGELSKQARAARAEFQQRGQDLAVKYVKKYRKAYLKDSNIKHLSRKGKKALDLQLANEVYLGPRNWYGKEELPSYTKAHGVPKHL